jgi:hypothetical protein
VQQSDGGEIADSDDDDKEGAADAAGAAAAAATAGAPAPIAAVPVGTGAATGQRRPTPPARAGSRLLWQDGPEPGFTITDGALDQLALEEKANSDHINAYIHITNTHHLAHVSDTVPPPPPPRDRSGGVRESKGETDEASLTEQGPTGATHAFCWNTHFLITWATTRRAELLHHRRRWGPLLTTPPYSMTADAVKRVRWWVFPFNATARAKHWNLFVLDARYREIHYFDSMRRLYGDGLPMERGRILALGRWHDTLVADLKSGAFNKLVDDHRQPFPTDESFEDKSPWTLVDYGTNFPQQARGGLACGLFVMSAIGCILTGAPWDFSSTSETDMATRLANTIKGAATGQDTRPHLPAAPPTP